MKRHVFFEGTKMRNGFLALIGLAALCGCSGHNTQDEVQAAAEPAPVEIRVAQAESRQIARTISVTGSLQPDETAVVSNQVAGLLASVHADFGQRVRKGQVIAELDQRELALQVDRSQAALAQALARIGLNPDQADVKPDTTPAIRQAQAQLENARTQYESAARLVKSGDIANDRFVEIEKAYRATEAGVDAARHELQVSLATIQSLQAETKLAQKRLGDTTIRAPFDGSVAERMASAGEYLGVNTPIVRLVKADPLRLRVDIPETAAGAIQPGTTLSFSTDGIAGERYQAVVREINPSLDPRSRSLSAEARLVKPDARLRPGMFVQVELTVDAAASILVVPADAVRTVAGLTKVFAVADGRVAEHRVEIGREVDGWVEIRNSNIEPGQPVATSHLTDLTDGTAVTATTAS